MRVPRLSWLPALAALVAFVGPAGCAPNDSLGAHAVTVLGAGVMNDPANRSLRFDILKFGLDSFCGEMLKGGAPLKFGDDEPVVGRFFADSCESQVLDDEAHKSFVVQYTGKGYAWTNLSKRIGFTSRGVVEYETDFQLSDGLMYVYFRPRQIDGAAFQATLVESLLAQGSLAASGMSADQLGEHIVESQLRRGFTVIRHDSSGDSDFALGLVPTGEAPFKPFEVKRTAKQVLANERTEVHSGQQDYIGAFEVTDSNQALYLTVTLDGAPNVDLLVVPKPIGDTLLDKYLHAAGGASLATPALLDETATQGVGFWQRFVNVEPGSYYLVVDNSAQLGKSAPDGHALDDDAAKVDYLVLLGDRP
ncbi:MAG TPA: hypothetical protein VK745_03265 [Polyangiaceae bacterium]|jgi:hypothetical protein|nr:hypothetical protein [Polyangiaceae bacterium]